MTLSRPFHATIKTLTFLFAINNSVEINTDTQNSPSNIQYKSYVHDKCGMQKAEKQTLVLLVIKRNTVPRSPTSVQPQFHVQEMFRLKLTFLLSIVYLWFVYRQDQQPRLYGVERHGN